MLSPILCIISNLLINFRLYNANTMTRKKYPPASVITSGKWAVTKLAKAKALEANVVKNNAAATGKRKKGTMKKKGKGRKKASTPDNDESNSDGSTEGDKSEEVKIEYVEILLI
jgi:replication initiation and membrane attachment protein DnaB